MTNTKPISLEKRREEWQRKLVLHRNVPASVLKVALAISWHFNRYKGGLAWPSIRTLSRLTNQAVSTVSWAVRWLKSHGYLEVQTGKTGLSNRYLPLFPTLQPHHVVEQGVPIAIEQGVPIAVGNEPLNNTPIEPPILTASLGSEAPKKNGIREREVTSTESQCFQLARENSGERGAALVAKALQTTSADDVLAAIEDAIESGNDLGHALWRP